MAKRSTGITLHNFTSLELRRKDFGLSHGIWQNGEQAVPPEKIGPGQKAWFGSESDGFATGTEGYVLYTSDRGDFHVGWDNPYMGGNGFGVDVPRGFKESNSDISGNNSNVNVFVYEE
jgi:hypothetical protein